MVHLGIDGLEDAERIGAGGNAVVYQARERDHDRLVAVKVLRLPDDGAIRRFDRERRAMGRLSDHPGIATIFRSGLTAAGDPYLVMPLYDRGSLADRIAVEGPLPWREAVETMAVVADTVHHAHRRNVIHRDLKPSNILVAPDGQPVVTDFGIAQFVGASATGASQALTFTPAFSAPEVLERADPSVAADVYGLGATLSALLTGELPFTESEDESIFAVMRRIAEDPVPDLRPRGIPDDVCAIVEQAMAKSSEDRPPSAAALAESLRAAAIGGTGAAPAPIPVTATGAGAGQAAIARAAQPGTVVYDRADEIGGGAGTPADRASTRGGRRMLIGGLVTVVALAAVVAVLLVRDNSSPSGGDAVSPTAEPDVTEAASTEPEMTDEAPAEPAVTDAASADAAPSPSQDQAGAPVPTAAPTATRGDPSPTEQAIQRRGTVRIGALPPAQDAGSVDTVREFERLLSADLAAELFGDIPIQFVELTAADRFAALDSGEVDLLVRRTTPTTSRLELADWTSAYLVEAPAIVARAGTVPTLDGFSGSVAALAGTTTEAQVADELSRRGGDSSLVLYETASAVRLALETGDADAAGTFFPSYLDWGVPVDLLWLGPLEPIAIGVAKGDAAFRDNVDAVLLQLIDDGTWLRRYREVVGDDPVFTIEQMLAAPIPDR